MIQLMFVGDVDPVTLVADSLKIPYSDTLVIPDVGDPMI